MFRAICIFIIIYVHFYFPNGISGYIKTADRFQVNDPPLRMYSCISRQKPYKTKKPPSVVSCITMTVMKWRRHPDSNWRVKLLQSFALPLGHGAEIWSGRRDSDSRHPPWQGGTLPLSYYRISGALGRNRTTDT